tara:strand:+ start:1620 stop:1892 length:273 start_codon:yes stop_codon:yes gene_type:complete
MAGKLRMVTNDKGERVPFYAADGKGKMKAGGLKEDIAKIKAKKGGKIPPQLREHIMKKKKKAKKKKKKMMKKRAGGFIQSHDSYIRDLIN